MTPAQPRSTARSATVYACGAPLYKYLPQHDSLLIALALRLPDAVFLFTGEPTARSTRLFAARLRNRFTRAGLDPDHHLAWQTPPGQAAPGSQAPTGDVHLDSIGWSDLPSARRALQHAIPVLTMPTGLWRGRQTAQWLHDQGMDHGVAATRDDFLDLATSLADPRRRAAYLQATSAAANALRQLTTLTTA